MNWNETFTRLKRRKDIAAAVRAAMTTEEMRRVAQCQGNYQLGGYCGACLNNFNAVKSAYEIARGTYFRVPDDFPFRTENYL